MADYETSRPSDSDAQPSVAGDSQPTPAVAQLDEGNGSSDWVSRLVELDEREPEPAAVAETSTRSAKHTSSQLPAAKEPQDKQTTFGAVAKALTAALILETLVILGYFAFRPEHSPPVFRLPENPTQQPESTPMASEAASSSLAGEVIVATEGGQFSSISQAIEQSPAGTRILVKPGTYREQLVLDKAVEVVGDGQRDDVIVEIGSGTLLTMKSDGAIVRGLTLIRSEGVAEKSAHAVSIEEGTCVLEDCDVTSKQGYCLLANGIESRPRIVNCRFHDCQDVGLYFRGGAGGDLSGCEVTGAKKIATLVSENANPTFRDCQWKNNTTHAIAVRGGQGEFIDSQITDHKALAIVVEDGGDPVFRNCRIERIPSTALQISEKAAGQYLDCKFLECEFGITVWKQSNPIVRNCTFDEMSKDALLIESGSKGLYDGCQIRGHADFNCVVIKGGSAPRITGCVLNGAKQGIGFAGESAGIVEDCEITGLGRIAVRLTRKSNPIFRNCNIHDNGSAAIYAEEQAEGLFEDCTFASNAAQTVFLTSGANTTIRRTRFADGQKRGISINSGAFGSLDDCEMSGFKDTPVFVETEGGVNMQNCRITDSEGIGIHLKSTGECSVSNCEVSNCPGGLFIGEKCRAHISQSTFRNCESFNVRIGGDSAPSLSDCEFRATDGHGVWIEEQAAPVLANCKSLSSGKIGFVALGKSQATLVDCLSHGNTAQNVAATDDCSLNLLRCTIAEGKSEGLLAGRRCRVNVTDCTFRANAGHAVSAADQVHISIEGGSISEGLANGIKVNAATAFVSGCQISAHKKPQVYVEESGEMTLQNCKLLNTDSNSISMETKSTLRADNCTFSKATYPTIFLDNESRGFLRNCSIGNCEASAINVVNSATLEMTRCKLHDNAGNGVLAKFNGNVMAKYCDFNNNAKSGLAILDDSRGTIEGPIFNGNGESGIYAEKNAALTVYSAKLNGSPVAVEVGEEGTVALYGCKVDESTQSPWKVHAQGVLNGANNTPPLNPER